MNLKGIKLTWLGQFDAFQIHEFTFQ